MKPLKPAFIMSLAALCAHGANVKWSNLSSERGELPVPGESTQQTGNVVADLDGDGVKDFEPDFLTVEAAYDIDGDGDLDVVFGGDWQRKDLWWWENPSPNFGCIRPSIPNKRRSLRAKRQNATVATGHGFHEGKLADLDGDGDLDILNKPYNWKAPRIDVWINGRKP
jgi:hypothetical protein